MKFKPVNKNILISLVEEKQQLQKEDELIFRPTQTKTYVVAEVLEIASDCHLDLEIGDKVLAMSNQIYEIVYEGCEYKVLEPSGVMGVFK